MKHFLSVIGIVLTLILIFIGCMNNNSDHKSAWDSDGMLIINGKRTFILGSYHLPKSENPYQELAEAGFNLVHAPSKIETLDQAQKAGLHAWVTVGTLNPEKQEESAEKLTNKIKKFKDHPALLIWESVDEPAWTWNKAECRIPPEPFAKGYELIKSIDPEHLMYMNHAPTNLVSTLQKYNSGTDIVACDVYPVIAPNTPPMFALFPDGYQGDLLNTYISQVGTYTKKMRKVAGIDRPLFMVLQGFAWENLRKKNRTDSLIRYPTKLETRFMAYHAIINGANGINYWGHAYTPQPSPFWSDLKSVVSELASIQDILVAPTKTMRVVKSYHELGHSIDMGIEIMVKKARGTYFLITANADKNPAKVSISGFGRDNIAKVLFEDQTIKIKDRVITDTYKPFEVHVYQLGNE